MTGPLLISSVVSLSFVAILSSLLFFFYWRRASAGSCQVSVVPVLKNTDCLEAIVGGLIHQGQWDKKVVRLYILLWDVEAKEETAQLCRQLCKRWEDAVWYCDGCESVEECLQELLIAKESEF